MFCSESDPTSLNSTLIALVPKNDNPNSMADMRSISLCNTVYKVIPKVIVSKLKPILLSITSTTQVSFDLRRHIMNNIFILQEIMHHFKCVKGKKDFIAWKVDLSKAYDRLSWKFLVDFLREIGISQGLRNLIEHCISSVSCKAIVNEEMTDYFSPKCVIRLGDPFSPYLFCSLHGEIFSYH